MGLNSGDLGGGSGLHGTDGTDGTGGHEDFVEHDAGEGGREYVLGFVKMMKNQIDQKSVPEQQSKRHTLPGFVVERSRGNYGAEEQLNE